ncbi:Acg family FMN-binding oxidoreductase [Actinophytocola oryzae]|uniref:Nitroreductase family protein n=1 Tax=Actinophytocola oryzae TaxID=502181 RepID=A0A4R7V3S6_9PSEU|nr:nitroreductase family protein [Actinophytocola oryzae]TDV42555.1 nitroreductase family protein [Actinophytocola oryzae]
MTSVEPDRKTVRAALALASHAPSIHNTQPWRWRIGDGSVHLFADRGRQVVATDPDGRDLIVSCGAALHHLRVAFAALGWATSVHRLPDPALPDHLASLELTSREPTGADVAAAAMISQRRADRRPMSDWPVSPGHLAHIAERARAQGALAVPITDPGARFELAGAIAQAAVIQRGRAGYAVELATWTGRARGGDDGVPAANIPTGGIQDADSREFPHGTLTRPTGKRYGQRTELLVIATSGDDVLSRLRAGEATSAALLAATELGLASCPLSQPLEIAAARDTVRDSVLGGTAEPQLVIRLGWAPISADPLSATPRRAVDDIIEPGDS